MTSHVDPTAQTRRLLLVLFIGAQFIGLARTFFMSMVSLAFNEVASICAYGSILLLPLIWVQYRNSTRPGEGTGSFAAAWVTLLAVLATLSALLGWKNGYFLKEVIQDYAPYVILCAFVLIGSRKAFWDDLVWLMPTLLFFALAVNAAGFVGFGELIERDIGERVARESLAYRTQSVLAMWGMALLLMRGQRPTYKILAVAALYFYLGQQVLFQKRLGTIESALYLGGFFFIIPIFSLHRSQRDRIEDAKLFIGLLVAAMLAGFIAIVLSGDLFIAQLQSLLQRFVGLGTGQQKEGAGLIATLFLENERLALAKRMFDDLSPWEWITGRGMGGHFAIEITLNSNDAVREQQYLSSYLSDVGQFGRRGLEIGWLMPFLKGGVVLMGMIFFGILSSIISLRKLKSDPIGLAAWTWLLIESVYLLQGGSFVVSTSYRLVLLGACMGRCLAPYVSR